MGLFLNPPTFYMEYLGVLVGFEYFCEVLTVGVCDKNLSELLTLHHLHNPLHTLAV